jgi:hypothetical protein
LGFGEHTVSDWRGREDHHAEWIIGTFEGPWIVSLRGSILCNSYEGDSIHEISQRLRSIPWAPVAGIMMLSNLAVRVNCCNGLGIDFIGRIGSEEALFHIMYPTKMLAEYSHRNGWRVGPSDKPWNDAGRRPVDA